MTTNSGQRRCAGDYDSHDWQWIDSTLVCVDCGLLDLAGERIMAEVAYRLELPRDALRRLA